MTPPDSDEAICRACRDGDHDNCVIANYRYTQPGPGCACPCPIEQPDSGEHKVPEILLTRRERAERDGVSLPLPLAQRILAALERDIWTELAAELRAVIGK